MTNELDNEDKHSQQRVSVWNSLEVAKIIVGALTPIMIFLFGAYLSHQQSNQAAKQASITANAASKERILNLRLESWRKAYPALQAYYDYVYDHIEPDATDVGDKRVAHVRLWAQARDAVGPETVLFSHDFQIAFVKYFTYLTVLDTRKISSSDDPNKIRDDLMNQHVNFNKIVTGELNPDGTYSQTELVN